MKKSIIAAALLAGTAAFANAQAPAVADSTSVAAATVLGEMVRGNLRGLESRGIAVDFDEFARAFALALQGKDTGMTLQQADEYMTALFMSTMPSAPGALDPAGQQAFVDAEAAAPGAVMLPGGTVMQVITEGEGAMPAHGQKVMVRYSGKLADGTTFDEQTQPVEFDVDGLIAGFTQGLLNMRPGGTYRLIIPADQGYGARGAGRMIPGNAALDFTVTLDQIIP